jgi:hypothetical protein
MCLFASYRIVIHPLAGGTLFEYLGNILPSVGTATLMAFVVFLLPRFAPTAPSLMLLTQIVVGATIYLTTLLLAQRAWTLEMVSFLKSPNERAPTDSCV